MGNKEGRMGNKEERMESKESMEERMVERMGEQLE
jgi:hypothetical protein